MTGTQYPAARRSRRRGALAAGLAGAAIALAGGGYALHAAAESSGYDAGYAAGNGAGEQQALARYDRGTPAYRAIYDRGHTAGRTQGLRSGERQGEQVGERHGEKVGFEHGSQIGLKRGEQQGSATGAHAALGGFGDWDDGAYYVVSVQPGGQPGVPFRIATRTAIEPLTDYRLCERNEAKLCSLPVVVASGG